MIKDKHDLLSYIVKWINCQVLKPIQEACYFLLSICVDKGWWFWHPVILQVPSQVPWGFLQSRAWHVLPGLPDCAEDCCSVGKLLKGNSILADQYWQHIVHLGLILYVYLYVCIGNYLCCLGLPTSALFFQSLILRNDEENYVYPKNASYLGKEVMHKRKLFFFSRKG